VKATITDAEGRVLTQPTPTKEFLRRQRALEAEEETTGGGDGGQAEDKGPQRAGAEYVAPIIVNNQRLGMIRMTSNGALAGVDEAKLAAMAGKLGLEVKQLRGLATQLLRARQSRPAAIQFLFLLANALARMESPCRWCEAESACQHNRRSHGPRGRRWRPRRGWQSRRHGRLFHD